MTTDTQFTAAAVADAIKVLEAGCITSSTLRVSLAALHIAQRVMTDGVIEGAIADHLGYRDEDRGGFSAEEAAVRTALTREET
jgi:hypothetical protein